MPSYPKQPANIMCSTSYHIGAVDIRWDSPLIVPENAGFKILGVDVWRADTGPEAPYSRLNINPLGSMVYRDLTQDELVPNEDVTNQFLKKGQDEHQSWVFQVRNRPMIRPESQFEVASKNADLEVKIYNPQTGQMQVVPVAVIRGDIGTVELIKTSWFDQITQKNVKALLPDFSNPLTKVTCSYHWGRRLYTLGLLERTYYKVSTVALDPSGAVVRTPLDQIEPATPYQQETLDYIWAEAIRRNGWILEQGADRVMVLLRKWMGGYCRCYNDGRGRAKDDCPFCYGTSYVGGYEGPFDLLIASPEAEKHLRMDTGGLKYEFEYPSWTLDTPLLRDWDIIIKRDGTRYILAGVNQQGQRDRILQQHFSMSLLPENDIRYRIPINPNSNRFGPSPVIYDGHEPKPATMDSPQIEVDRNSQDPTLKKGRTIVYENLQ